MIRKAGTLIISITVLVVLMIGCTQSPIIGKWYQEDGYGTIEFKKGGNCMVETIGIPFEASYKFDNKTNEGTITIELFEEVTIDDFSYADDSIIYQGQTYTTEYVEQKDFDEAWDEAFDKLSDELENATDTE